MPKNKSDKIVSTKSVAPPPSPVDIQSIRNSLDSGLNSSLSTEEGQALVSYVDSLLKANESLAGQLATSEDVILEDSDRIGDFTAQVQALEKELSVTKESEKRLASSVELLRTERDELSVTLSKATESIKLMTLGSTTVGDLGIVDGKTFRVVSRHTAKWVGTEVSRRHIDESATVLVLDRLGD